MKYYSLRLLLVAIIIALMTTGCGGPKLLSEGSSLMTSLSSNPNLSSFTSLLKTPGLDKALGDVIKKSFTLLAPTNEAMLAMGPDAMVNLTKPENIGQLSNMVKNQIVPGKMDAADLMKGGVSTAEGNPLNLSGANLGSLISAGNVNIIPIDKVLK